MVLQYILRSKEKVLQVRDSKGNFKGDQAVIGDVDIVNL
jgi:hypothetical protein